MNIRRWNGKVILKKITQGGVTMAAILNFKDYKKNIVLNKKEKEINKKETQINKNKYLESWDKTSTIEKIMIQDLLEN